MKYSSTVRNGAGRDEALKRRNSQMREALGMDTAPTEKPDQPKADDKPSEATASSCQEEALRRANETLCFRAPIDNLS